MESKVTSFLIHSFHSPILGSSGIKVVWLFRSNNYPNVAAWFAKRVPSYSPVFLAASDQEDRLSFPKAEGLFSCVNRFTSRVLFVIAFCYKCV